MNTPTVPRAARLDALSVLRITGDDRHVWLQGQVTQDVHAYVERGTLHAFHLDAQGKILAELRGVHVGSSWLLVLETTVAAELVASLERRIIMEDVTLQLRADHSVMTIVGTEASALATDVPVVASLTSDRFGAPSIELIVEESRREDAFRVALASVHAHGGAEASVERLDALRALIGTPRFGVDFGVTTLPQESGRYRATVSFSKGCYVGQEPVVMIEHRGKPPRRMCTIESVHTLPAAPFDLARADGTVVGRCTSLAAVPEHAGDPELASSIPDPAQTGSAACRGIALVKRADAVVGAELFVAGTPVRLVTLVGEPVSESGATPAGPAAPPAPPAAPAAPGSPAGESVGNDL